MTTLQIVALVVMCFCISYHYGPNLVRWLAPPLRGVALSLRAQMAWSFGTVFRVIRLSLHLLGIAAVSMVIWYLFLLKSDLPDLEELIHYRPKQITPYLDRNGALSMQEAEQYRVPISYDDLPLVVRQAIIAAEDKRYYSPIHTGVDILALPRVVKENVSGNVQGGSGISQQLARTMYLEERVANERSDTLQVDSWFTREVAERIGVPWTNRLSRKVVEYKYSFHLMKGMTDYYDIEEEHHDTLDLMSDGPRLRAQRKAKEHLLGVYASQVYLGHGVYGFSYAARFYYCKSIYELRPHEAATIASFIPSPAPFSRFIDEGGAGYAEDIEAKTLRRNVVLHRMARNDFLTADELAMEQSEPVVFCEREFGGAKTIAPAIINRARRELTDLGISQDAISSGFVRPELSFDLDIQRAVNEAVEVGMEQFEERWPGTERPQVAMVVLKNGGESAGAILGMYGGHYEDTTYNYSLLNRATDSIRQPGSTFKGIDMLAALSVGKDLTTTYPDVPMRIPMGRGKAAHYPRNYNGVYTYTNMNLREILARSQNLPTLWMARDIGTEHIITTARALGITTELDRYWVMALGSNGVIPLEFANAYRGIASGIQAEPYVVSRVTDEQGTVLVERNIQQQHLPFRDGRLQMMHELLRGTIRLPKGTGRSMMSFFVPLGGKTGTSNDHKDAWFVSFTYGEEGITVLVWVGYDEFNRSLPHQARPRATGGTVALPIARAFYERVYGEGMPLGHPTRFPEYIEQSIDSYIYDAYFREEEEEKTPPIVPVVPPH